jgi:hypothetical protein
MYGREFTTLDTRRWKTGVPIGVVFVLDKTEFGVDDGCCVIGTRRSGVKGGDGVVRTVLFTNLRSRYERSYGRESSWLNLVEATKNRWSLGAHKHRVRRTIRFIRDIRFVRKTKNARVRTDPRSFFRANLSIIIMMTTAICHESFPQSRRKVRRIESPYVSHEVKDLPVPVMSLTFEASNKTPTMEPVKRSADKIGHR